MTDSLDVKQFLTMQAEDPYITCDPDTCGQCARAKIQSEVARDILNETPAPAERVIHQWSQESDRRWRQSKFYTLWQAEQRAGRDPKKAFEDKGWKP